MTKSEYAQLLLTEEWNIVRKRILARDEYKCKCCGKTNVRLSVHHKVYLEGKLPWEVPDNYLESLCDKCHEKAHKNRLISSFIKKSLPSNKKKKAKKEKLKKNSEEEKLLIAKLCLLERLYPASKQWNNYKKQLFQYGSLPEEVKVVINNKFNGVRRGRK